MSPRWSILRSVGRPGLSHPPPLTQWPPSVRMPSRVDVKSHSASCTPSRGMRREQDCGPTISAE
eukprot:6794630-Alexandrium_andersonii.AAC.1